jgi:hypothetical protein
VATSAAADLHRAADRADSSPWLSALSHLPVVGAQVRATRDLANAADRVGQLGEETANEIQRSLDQAASAGAAGRVQLVDALSTAAGRLGQDLRTIDVGAPGWLLPPLRTARADLVRHLQNARNRLEDGRATLTTLRGFLVGPRRYLVLGGNNAEMRSMGIATTSGISTIHDGSVDVGAFRINGDTAIAKPGVPLPRGWDWLYGYLDPNTEYANMVSSPNFPLTGQTAAALSAQNIYGGAGGVIYIDTVALQGILSVVGPVSVDGVTYDGDNAARLLINENYFRFSTPDQTERRDAQGRVASAIFDALNTRHVSLVKLVAKLQELARSRHVAAWSELPEEQKLWHDLGVDGSRSANDLLVSAQDLGASKLDYYVTEQVVMDVQAVGPDRRVDLSISLTNPVREQRSVYVDGGSIYADPGEYGVYLVVFSPRSAFDFTHDEPPYTSSATDGDLTVTTFTTRVPMGSTKMVRMSFMLPGKDSTITVVPSARITPVQWTWTWHSTFNDAFPTTLDLGALPVGAKAPRPGWLLSGLLLFALGGALAGDAWGRAGTRRARIDANLGWWLLVIGLALMTVQAAIYITAP